MAAPIFEKEVLVFKNQLIKLAKDVLFVSPLRSYFFPRYLYNFSPSQLNFLCSCIHETRNVEGSIAEIGVARGHSTVYLNKFITDEKIEKKYYAIDTFSGFVQEDIEHEVTERGKSWSYYNASYGVNDKRWFDAAMVYNKIDRVQSIQADVNHYDLRKLGPLSFCLLDVDLYRPMIKALGELYETLSPGGIIVVDDCDEKSVLWDGSSQAYNEFMAKHNSPTEVLHTKLGIIRKPL